MNPIYSSLKPGILKLLGLFYEDDALTTDITYKLYQGRTHGHATFKEYKLKCILIEDSTGDEDIASGASTQATKRQIIIRESDLDAEEISPDSLSLNDNVDLDGQSYDVVAIDRTLDDIAVKITIQGS